MLSLPPGVRWFVALDRIDTTKGFAVAAIVLRQRGLGLLNGHIVLFMNKRGNLMKLLFFDRGAEPRTYIENVQARVLDHTTMRLRHLAPRGWAEVQGVHVAA